MTEPLAKCFFIYDNMCEDEFAQQEELLLFFHPEEVEINKKLFLLGGCAAMLAFSKHFSPSTVKVMKMERIKLAIKEEGKVVLVLTSEITDSDDAVSNQLALLYDAFCFFCGSFEILLERFNTQTRKELLTEMRKIGKELMPLILNYHNNPVKSLQLLSYSQLPEKTSRNFVLASQILNGLKELDPNNHFGACLLYDSSILSTQLDSTITRYILCAELMRNNNDNNNSIPDQFKSEFTEIHRRVFIPNDQLKKKKIQKSSNQGEFMGLYILSIGKLSLALILTISSLEDTRHIQRLKSFAEVKLDSLEKSIYRSFAEGGSCKKTINNVCIPHQYDEGPASCYHFLMYHQQSNNAIGSSLSPMDSRFSWHMSNAHNTFSDDTATTQILLRDHKNGMYCRKVLGKQIYFQPSSTNSHNLFMEHIEKTAQKSLKNDYNVNFF